MTGAAVGTTIGRGRGVRYQLYQLSRPGGRLSVARSHVGVDVAALKGILRISGVPGSSPW